MTARQLLTTAALLVLTFAASAAVQCEPDCSGKDPGDKVEDPRNCTQFYVCVDMNKPSDYPVSCQPPVSVFDPVVGECVAGESCVASCNPPACKLRCDAVLDVIANPWDCSTYYFCDAAYNPGNPQYCPSERPYFDGETCTNDASVCCEVPCSPICGPGDVQIPDPLDCTQYYVCVVEGVPTEDNHHSCDAGETFQPSSSLCVPGGTCYALCGGTTTTSTTTSTTTTTDSTTTSTTTTTTDSTTTMIITTSEPAPECIAFLTCPSAGYFPMCSSCEPGYFQCPQEGLNGVPMLCPNGYAFNTNPDYPFCVLISECPYAPSTATTSSNTHTIATDARHAP